MFDQRSASSLLTCNCCSSVADIDIMIMNIAITTMQNHYKILHLIMVPMKLEPVLIGFRKSVMPLEKVSYILESCSEQ